MVEVVEGGWCDEIFYVREKIKEDEIKYTAKWGRKGEKKFVIEKSFFVKLWKTVLCIKNDGKLIKIESEI